MEKGNISKNDKKFYDKLDDYEKAQYHGIIERKSVFGKIKVFIKKIGGSYKGRRYKNNDCLKKRQKKTIRTNDVLEDILIRFFIFIWLISSPVIIFEVELYELIKSPLYISFVVFSLTVVIFMNVLLNYELSFKKED